MKQIIYCMCNQCTAYTFFSSIQWVLDNVSTMNWLQLTSDKFANQIGGTESCHASCNLSDPVDNDTELWFNSFIYSSNLDKKVPTFGNVNLSVQSLVYFSTESV